MTIVTSPFCRPFATFGRNPTRRAVPGAAREDDAPLSVVNVSRRCLSWLGFCSSSPVCSKSAGRSGCCVHLGDTPRPPYTDGFSRPLPIGTAYGVWVGIGAAGAAVLGMVVLGEPVTAARIFFVCLLLVAVVGLKATSGH